MEEEERDRARGWNSGSTLWDKEGTREKDRCACREMRKESTRCTIRSDIKSTIRNTGLITKREKFGDEEKWHREQKTLYDEMDALHRVEVRSSRHIRWTKRSVVPRQEERRRRAGKKSRGQSRDRKRKQVDKGHLGRITTRGGGQKREVPRRRQGWKRAGSPSRETKGVASDGLEGEDSIRKKRSLARELDETEEERQLQEGVCIIPHGTGFRSTLVSRSTSIGRGSKNPIIQEKLTIEPKRARERHKAALEAGSRKRGKARGSERQAESGVGP
ncbi:hypothetical protein KM043_009000 [Ampulex compressa]|nr:hypothetical protein KM043_009000 [Ampulex compressa]